MQNFILKYSLATLIGLSSTTYVPVNAGEVSKGAVKSAAPELQQMLHQQVLYAARHLDEITFSELFPKPFYQKSYFTPVAIGASIVVAGAVSYFTAGAGAPAAATGVSTVATAVGGGGQGAYMAGLSAVGSMFGGNAMLGGAILNGISIGTIGGGVGGGAATMAKLSLAGKAASAINGMFIGMALIPGENGQPNKYVFDLNVPQVEIGSGTVRQLAKDIKEVQEAIVDAYDDEDEPALKRLVAQRDQLYRNAVELLKKELSKPKLYHREVSEENFAIRLATNDDYLYQSPENLIILSVISYRGGEPGLFIQGIEAARDTIDFYKKYLEIEDSYLNYLEGVAELYKEAPDLELAKEKFRKSWDQESYALEPAVAIVNILGEKITGDKVKMVEIANITDKAVEQFDDDKYTPRINEMGAYYNAATIFLNNGKYSMALKYYRLANDSIGFITRHLPGDASTDLVNNVRIMEAVCLSHLEKNDEAVELFNDIIDDYEDQPEKAKRYTQIFRNL